MANKLTKEKLNLLIEQVLSEKKISDKIGGGRQIDTDTTGFAKKKFGAKMNALTAAEFETLSAEDGQQGDFTASDLYNAFREPSNSSEYKTAMKFNNAKKKYQDAVSGSLAAAVSKLNPKTVKDMEDVFDPNKKVKAVKASGIDSMAFKALQTVSADPSDATAMGAFPEGLSTAINTVFASDNTFTDRINKVSSLTKLIYKKKPGGYKKNASEIEDKFKKSSDLLATVMFLDYITTLVREIDSGAAAYQFESFLAMLSGGRVKGKAKTEAGKMGATDFETNTGVQGSAKYLKDVNLSSVTQAANGFEKDTPYIYIIAHKVDSAGGGMSDPRQIASVNIYMLTIITPDLTNFIIRNSNGDYIYRKVKGDGKIQLGGIGKALVDPLTLHLQGDQTNANSLSKQLSKNIQDKLGKKNRAAVTAYKKISENSYTADEKLKAYMVSGKVGAGNAALKAMMQMELGISELTTAFTRAKEPGESKYTQQIKKGIDGNNLKENKTKSLKELDKLIEHVILNKMNK